MQLLHYFLIFVGAAAAGLAVVAWLFARIASISVDNEKARNIAQAIREGAMTFLQEEYRIIAVVVALVACLLGYFMSPLAAAVFVVGALFSLTTGLLGMHAATLANVRTTMAAKDHGEHQAFMIAFFGGGVMGFAVASFGLLGLGTVFYLFNDRADLVILLTCFGFGARPVFL